MNAQTELPEQPTPEPAMLYELKLQGHLGSEWSAWFEGAVIIQEANGITVLTCPVCDQSALHGLLKKVRDLGMPLISVIRVQPYD